MTKKINKFTKTLLESPISSNNNNSNRKVFRKVEAFYRDTIRSIDYGDNTNTGNLNIFPQYNPNSYILEYLPLRGSYHEHKRRFYGECKNLDILADLLLSTDKRHIEAVKPERTLLHRDPNDLNEFDIETLEDELQKQAFLINKTGYTQQVLENNKTVLFCGWKTCGASFKSKYYVFKHIKTHIDVLPYRCQICGMRFIRKDNGKAHLKICIRKQMTRR